MLCSNWKKYVTPPTNAPSESRKRISNDTVEDDRRENSRRKQALDETEQVWKYAGGSWFLCGTYRTKKGCVKKSQTVSVYISRNIFISTAIFSCHLKVWVWGLYTVGSIKIWYNLDGLLLNIIQHTIKFYHEWYITHTHIYIYIY